MKIIFTNHAKYRLMERDISVEVVKQVVKFGMQKRNKYGMLLSRKVMGKKTAEVVYKMQGVNYIIITAYYEN